MIYNKVALSEIVIAFETLKTEFSFKLTRSDCHNPHDRTYFI